MSINPNPRSYKQKVAFNIFATKIIFSYLDVKYIEIFIHRLSRAYLGRTKL